MMTMMMMMMMTTTTMMMMMMARLVYFVNQKIIHVIISAGICSEWPMNVLVVYEMHVPPFV